MQAETRAHLAEHRRERTGVLADLLVERITSDNAGYRAAGVVDRDDLRESCLDNIRRVLELLDRCLFGLGAPAADDPALRAARTTGRRRAEQGQPLDDVLRSFRMGGRMIWEDLLERTGHRLGPDEVRQLGTALWEVVDLTSSQVAVAYHAHERAVVRADEQLRAELWEGVLAGRAHDHVFALRVAHSLDLPVDGDLLVVDTTDTPDAPADHTSAGLDPATAADALAPHASAWVRRASGVVGLVVLREPDPAAALARLRSVVGRAPCGVSGMVHGLAEVGTGHRQAVLAREVLGGRAGFASYDDHLPDVLLLGDPGLGSRLVQRWLGPVLALPGPEAAALLATLVAWVESAGSPSRTAERVPCHRNTVLNRVRRISELTGHELAEGAPSLDLELALRAHRLGISRTPTAP